jgi:hypothetical protein
MSCPHPARMTLMCTIAISQDLKHGLCENNQVPIELIFFIQ